MNRRAFVASGALLAVAAAGAARAQSCDGPFVTDARVTLGACRSIAEEHLTGVLRALKVLASTSDARSGRWERVRPALQELSGDTPTAAAVWSARPDGSYATVEGGPREQTLTDRSYFAGLMAGQDVRAALVISKSTGHRSIIVAAPIRRHGRVIGALGVSARARLVSALIDKGARLPDNLIFYALDAEGRTAVHRDPERMFQYPSDMGDPSLKSAVATILSRPEGVVEYDFGGRHRTAVFDRSEITGWSFVLAAVRSPQG